MALTGNWKPDTRYKDTPLDWSSPQPFPEQLTLLTYHQTNNYIIMPKAASSNNYIIGDRHITRTALTLHTTVPQSYNELGHFVVPHSGMDIINTVNGTCTDVNGIVIPRPSTKWYATSFAQYGIEDFAWATTCQSVWALHEFEDDKKVSGHSTQLLSVALWSSCSSQVPDLG